MKFSDIVGQDTAISVLKRAVANRKHYHAYLFTGPDGVGKKLTAVAFAKVLNCKNLDDDSPGDSKLSGIDACDECTPCRKINGNNHPDIEIVSVLEDKKLISIEQIHDLQKRVWLKSMEARRKVYIIDEANNMSSEAANCLLKTLEEPNENVVFILIVQNIYSLLPTIRSRCQVIKFKAMPVKVISSFLIKNYSQEEDSAGVIAELSQGRLGTAIAYAQQDIESVMESVGEIIDIVKDRKKGGYPDYEKIFEFTGGISRDKEFVVNMLNCLLLKLRSSFVKKPTDRLKTEINLVLRTQNLIGRNVNAQNVLNDMLMRLGG